MTHKKFKVIKIVIAFFLAIIMAQAVIFNNYILASFAIAAAIAVLFISRKNVDEVLTDERDAQISGKAAKITLNVFSVIGAAITFVLMGQNPLYKTIGSTLAYSVCSLLLLYSIIFYYYEKHN